MSVYCQIKRRSRSRPPYQQNIPNIRISSAFVLILRQKVVKEFYTWIWPFHKLTTIDERLSQWTIFIYNVCRFINHIFSKLHGYYNMHVTNKQLNFIVFLTLRISLYVNQLLCCKEANKSSRYRSSSSIINFNYMNCRIWNNYSHLTNQKNITS